MQHRNFSAWAGAAVLAVLLVLPVIASAQGPATPATSTQAQGDGQCQDIRDNFGQVRQNYQEARQAYRQAVQEYGRDSEQARAAQRELKQAQHKLRAAQNRGKHCRRHARRNDGDATTERSAERRRNRDAQSTQRPRNRRII